MDALPSARSIATLKLWGNFDQFGNNLGNLGRVPAQVGLGDTAGGWNTCKVLAVLNVKCAAARPSGGSAEGREAALRRELQVVKRERDAAIRHKEEALRGKEEALRELRGKEEATRRAEAAVGARGEAIRSKDAEIARLRRLAYGMEVLDVDAGVTRVVEEAGAGAEPPLKRMRQEQAASARVVGALQGAGGGEGDAPFGAAGLCGRQGEGCGQGGLGEGGRRPGVRVLL